MDTPEAYLSAIFDWGSRSRLRLVDQRPIGIFDSGVGGLTVARAIIDQLPHESVIYVGDTLNSPYGPKPISEVRRLALEVMDELVAKGVKLLVIACNSASAAVLRDARERYTEALGVPVVEVIQPAVRRAVTSSKNRKVGVIGTLATVTSGAYQDAFAAAIDFEITLVACPSFVDFVERGITSGPALLSAAKNYLAPIQAAGVDTLVLGCTHYPLLSAALQYVMGESVNLVSSDEETASDVFRVLAERDIGSDTSTEASYEFLATGDAQEFENLAKRFLGPEVIGVRQIKRKNQNE